MTSPPEGPASDETVPVPALMRQSSSPVLRVPTKKHRAEAHEPSYTSATGAAGTFSVDQTPRRLRTCAVVVGLLADPVVPRAMHAPELVHPTDVKGTLMLLEG